VKGPVLLLTTNLARGGAETQVALLAEALRGRGWRVEVASMVEPSAFREDLTAAGIPVHSLGMRPGAVNVGGAGRLAALLRRVRPAVLHSHMFHANVLARLARLVFPIPKVIGTLHSIAESGHGSEDATGRDRVYRMTDRLADVTVAVSNAVAERHAVSGAVSRERLTVIPNGVDVEKFRPDAEARGRMRAELGIADEFVWLAAGRLIWKKDYPTLLAAMERLPGGVLHIAGSGPLEGELRARAKTLGGRVRFLGAREDLPALMNAADGLALSSVVEGMPMVLLEAAASGLPCVATRAGGAEEVVADGETGYLVSCGDSEALAEAMARLAGLRAESRQAMGRAARERALAKFDIRRIAEEWEALYLNVVQ
jgi:glycosyltransferase involved in cell wall biosynthesis